MGLRPVRMRVARTSRGIFGYFDEWEKRMAEATPSVRTYAELGGGSITCCDKFII